MRGLINMDRMTNILEIIKTAPEDHIYWCTLCGPCKVKINELMVLPITVFGTEIERTIELNSFGEYVTEYSIMKCVLFPSKENRDWDSFKNGIIGWDKAKDGYCEFDIVKAKNGAPVKTRAGFDARIICYDYKGEYYPIIALVKKDNAKREIIYDYNADGTCSLSESYGLNGLDLVMAPVHCEGYATARVDESGNIHLGLMYSTPEEAMN